MTEKTQARSVRRLVWLGLALAAAMAALAPYVRADFYGERIRQALELSLGRKVEIGSTGMSLLRGPGFTLRRVIIHDDPAAGIEPFAYVGAIEARIHLATLLGGRLEFSDLRLDRPSVNLVKLPEGGWNFQQLLNRAAQSPLPRLKVSQGRINFKLNGVKSVFYVTGADLEVRPPGRNRAEFDLEFSGAPARTDRTARGFGEIRGRGRWRAGPSGGNLTLDMNLARSSLGEMVALLRGADIGMHGQVSGRVGLRGPLKELAVSGALQFREIHRWDQLPPYAEGGALDLKGTLNLSSQDLALELQPTGRTDLTAKLRISNLLNRPLWDLSLGFEDSPLRPLGELAGHMGIYPPDELQVDGSMTGAVDFSPLQGIRGSVVLKEAVIGSPKRGPMRLAEARLALEGARVRLSPAVAEFQSGETAKIEFDYTAAPAARLDLRVASASLNIEELIREGGALPGVPPPPFATRLKGGTWSGWLRYRRADANPGSWNGAGQIQGAEISVPGLAFPVLVERADLELQGERIEAREFSAQAGETVFRGEYRYDPAAVRPHHFEGRASRLSGPRLEALLLPTLRRPQGLFARTLGLGRARLPQWLADRKAEGTVTIESFEIAGESFAPLKLRFFWDGPNLDIPRFEARVRGGNVSGHAQVDLRGTSPVYVLAGRVQDVDWRGGSLNGDGTVRTSGAGNEVYWNLRAEGSFRAQSVELPQDDPSRTISGSWALRWERRQPRLEMRDVRVTEGQETLTGHGTTGANDQLLIEVGHGDKRLRLSGDLRTLELAATDAR